MIYLTGKKKMLKKYQNAKCVIISWIQKNYKFTNFEMFWMFYIAAFMINSISHSKWCAPCSVANEFQPHPSIVHTQSQVSNFVYSRLTISDIHTQNEISRPFEADLLVNYKA